MRLLAATMLVLPTLVLAQSLGPTVGTDLYVHATSSESSPKCLYETDGAGNGSCTCDGSTFTFHDTVIATLVSGSAVPFSAITGATNTAAAMLVGTGASLATTGAGTIDATALEGTDLGTLADARLCAYDAASTEIDCNTAVVWYQQASEPSVPSGPGYWEDTSVVPSRHYRATTTSTGRVWGRDN